MDPPPLVNLNHLFSGDSLTKVHNGTKFSTPDRDSTIARCPAIYGGSWWYGAQTICSKARLTGKYLTPGHFLFGQGMHWNAFLGMSTSLKWAEMKLKVTRTGRMNNTTIHILLKRETECHLNRCHVNLSCKLNNFHTRF